MITKCFALLDTKVGVYNTPFFMLYEGSAIRACVDLGTDMTTSVGRHPGDYSLCEIGQFDDQTGVFHPQPPRIIGVISSFLPPRTSPMNNMPLFSDEAVAGAVKAIQAKPPLLVNGRHPEMPANGPIGGEGV